MANHYGRLELELHQEREKQEQLTKLLESLTPGGSEFYNDPERCTAWVKARLATVTEQVKKRQQAEADNAAIILFVEKVARSRWVNGRFDAREILSVPHPGAALLGRLRQTEKALELATINKRCSLNCEYATYCHESELTCREVFLAKAKEAANESK